MKGTGSYWFVNIGSADGMVPSDKNPLHGPMLIKIHDTLWHEQATMSQKAMESSRLILNIFFMKPLTKVSFLKRVIRVMR